MGRITAFILSRFRGWEPSARAALALALALLVITGLAAAVGPAELRRPALIGTVGLLLVAQGIFMWANRHMVTPFTRAQRHYLAEDFEAARRELEALDAAGKAGARALTLLGNTYRQLGQLEESQDALTKALSLDPDDPFSLYGFGRTLLVRGLYAEASRVLRRALDLGAPPVVSVDLAEALYREGREQDARVILQSDQASTKEPHRKLLAAYLLYRMGTGEPPAPEVVQGGLAYWQENARRFQATAYGLALSDDVRHMQALIEER